MPGISLNIVNFCDITTSINVSKMTDAEIAMNMRYTATNQTGLDEVTSDGAAYMELQHDPGAAESQYCRLEPFTREGQSAVTSRHVTSATGVNGTGHEYANA